MLLSSAKKTQTLCFWQLWNPRRLWLTGWRGGRNEFSPTRAWMELPVSPAFISLPLSSKVHPRLVVFFSSNRLRIPPSLLGWVWPRGWGPSCMVCGSCQTRARAASLDVQIFRNKPQPARWSMKRLGAGFWQRSSLRTQLVLVSKPLQALASFVSLCAGVLHL